MNIDHEYGTLSTRNTKISSNTSISHKTYKQFALVEYRIVNLKQSKVDSIKETENMYCKMKLYMDIWIIWRSDEQGEGKCSVTLTGSGKLVPP